MPKPARPSKPDNIAKPLLAWYDRYARDLPWRVPPAQSKHGIRQDPYRAWLAEIMLQQTTVETVKPRYIRFLRRWPGVIDLAKAQIEDVLHEWAGLGYYARARNLHKCAVVVGTEHAGIFPSTEEGLRLLPGIGPYTAAAIAAIAFDQKTNVVDGNVERVMARLHAQTTPLPKVKPKLTLLAAKHVPAKRVGDYAQALMDLGATICTPRNPSCDSCPLNKQCLALAKNIATTLPRRAASIEKPTRFGDAYVIKNKAGEVFLIRRPSKGLLGGMLAFPSSEWGEKPAEHEKPFKASWKQRAEKVQHTFTHFHLHLTVYETRKENPPLEGGFVKAPEKAGLPTVFAKVLNT